MDNLYYKERVVDKFLKEKAILKNAVYDEIEHLEKKGYSEVRCSLEMLKDALFIIDKGFEDLMDGLSLSNLEDRENKLTYFKESLRYAIYNK